VYLGVVGPGVDVVERQYWPFDRERVRRAAAWGLMDLLRRKLSTVPRSGATTRP
jgi:hypothetical protein